jgi:hypothetical protein
MWVKENFDCDFRNINFIEMVELFKILIECSIFLIEKKNFKETFLFYNYMFEKYLPESDSSLDDIDYGKLFIGKYAHETTDIYKRLLDLWMELQNKYSLSEKDILELKFDEK